MLKKLLSVALSFMLICTVAITGAASEKQDIPATFGVWRSGDGQYTSLWLEGVQYRVYLSNDGEKGEMMGTLQTDALGECYFEEMESDTEYILEEVTPQGYAPINDIRFVIRTEGEYDYVEIKNPEDNEDIKGYIGISGTTVIINTNEQVTAAAITGTKTIGAQANPMLFFADGETAQQSDLAGYTFQLYDVTDKTQFDSSSDSYGGSYYSADVMTFNSAFPGYDLEGKDVAQQVISDADGNFAFSPLVFYREGTYEYVIKELEDTENAAMVYDRSQYKVTYEVGYTDDYKLTIISTTIEKNGEETVDEIIFSNRWIDPVFSTVRGTKLLDGQPAQGFDIVICDGEGNEIETVTSGEEGKFKFTALEFATPGEYRYTVKEAVSADEGIVCDDAVYYITYSVERVGDELEITGRTIVCDEQPQEEIVFNNKTIRPA
ncbi:MAG: hypothetical protein IIV99_04265, partial [Oscillospiraceae bacterium]|nr:hypothetical protein [Oscillospiraceae bacterium]